MKKIKNIGGFEMKQTKSYKLEKDARNIGSEKWDVVGKSGVIYYSGGRFDCCFYINKNREYIESEESFQKQTGYYDNSGEYVEVDSTSSMDKVWENFDKEDRWAGGDGYEPKSTELYNSILRTYNVDELDDGRAICTGGDLPFVIIDWREYFFGN